MLQDRQIDRMILKMQRLRSVYQKNTTTPYGLIVFGLRDKHNYEHLDFRRFSYYYVIGTFVLLGHFRV